MKFLAPEPTVNIYNEGFETNDFLNRRKVGKSLSDLVERIEDPLVIALDGMWGTGKSYFLKRWVGAHSLENNGRATTVYFDAFANDFVGDPLPAIISCISERIPRSQIGKLDVARRAAQKLAKPLARLGLAVGTYGATEVFSGVADIVVNTVAKESEAELDKLWAKENSKSSAMEEFKSAIQTLTANDPETGESTPLVIVIDELDRCRPDYALEVLEVMKHFFSVSGVHFVLGVNLSALENSVKVRYGDQIDAVKYLKKFIQVTLKLPTEFGPEHRSQNANLLYFDHLIQEMGVPRHISAPLKTQIKIINSSHAISIRDISQIVSSATLLSNDVLTRENTYSGWLIVLVDLLVAKIIRPDLFPRFLDATISRSELESYLGASEKTLSQELDGQHNPSYDRKLFFRYYTWLFIIGGGKISGAPEGLTQHISKQFDSFGYDQDARKLPAKINSRWLDRFQFFEEQM